MSLFSRSRLEVSHEKDNMIKHLNPYFRCNGTMGSFQTNGHAVSIQLMRKFVTSSKLQEFDNDKLDDAKRYDYTDILHVLESEVIDETSFESDFEILKSACRRAKFNTETVSELLDMCTKYCKFKNLKCISSFGRSALRIQVGNQVFACNQYRGSSPYSYVIARWHDKTGFSLRPAIIKQIYEVQATVGGEVKKYWIAEMDWFKDFELKKGKQEEIEKSKRKKYFYGKDSNITVWNTTFESGSRNKFIPIRCIKERFVYVKESKKFEDGVDSVVLSISLPFNSFL